MRGDLCASISSSRQQGERAQGLSEIEQQVKRVHHACAHSSSWTFITS
jgi:hypothetical protein